MSGENEGAAAPETPAAPVAATPEAGEALNAAAAAAAAAPVDAPAAPEVDLDTEPSDDIYSDPEKVKGLVKSLREEAAKRRTQAKEASAAFEGWADTDADILRDVIKTAAADPKVGAAKMREIADLLDKGDTEGAAAVAADASPDAAEAAKGLTEDDVQKRIDDALAKKDKESFIESEKDRILGKATELGYEINDDPANDLFLLLNIAHHQTAGDLDKAHEMLEAKKQAVIDAYVADVKERSAGSPKYAGRGAAAPVDLAGDAKDMKEGSERLRQRIRNLR